MRLATIRREGTTAAAVIEGDIATVLSAPDVGAVLRAGVDRVDRKSVV